MKILFDARTATSRFPGIGRYTASLAKALAEVFQDTGDSITIVRNPQCTFHIRETDHVKQTTCIAPPDDPDGQTPMRKLAEQIKPDIYHTPHRMCPTIGYDAAPIVLTIHDFCGIKCRSEKSPQAAIAHLKSMSNALSKCKYAMAVSETTLNDAQSLFPDFAAKCVAIPHGVSKRFKPNSEDIYNHISLSYDYKRSSILYLGSNAPHKNIANLLKAYAKAQPLISGVDLILAGYGCDETSYYKSIVEKLGISKNVKWLGEILEEDLPALIGSVKAFVLPSLYEGFGLPVLEAMAVGTPVACSNTPALLELSKDCAIHFDPNNIDEMSQALVNIVVDDSLRTVLREKAIDRASLYTWENVAKSTIDLYKKALNL